MSGIPLAFCINPGNQNEHLSLKPLEQQIMKDFELSNHQYTAFDAKGNFEFPVLFITVACGSVSGFHSLISSGTTSKQLDNENNAKMIGYGAMLIECVLAVIALIF